MKEQGLNLQFIYGDNFILLILALYGQLNMTYFLESFLAAIEFSFYNTCRCPLSSFVIQQPIGYLLVS